MASEVVNVAGVVVAGDRRGRELGYPTANVEVPGGTALPPDGVYAGWFCRADGTRHAAAISIGPRPTYYGPDGARLVEAYLLEFDGDLYGEAVSVELAGWVRGQARFASSAELVAQIAHDVERVRELTAG